MKITENISMTSELLLNKDKTNWSFNVIPAFNFGNNPGRKGCILNFVWLMWCLHIRVNINK
jgi:hypothetical protein